MFKQNIKPFLLFLFIFPLTLFANDVDTLTALHTQAKIKLDGRLNEEVWNKAMRISNFTQREMAEGEAATEKTEVAI
ncbi:MAG: hypothetical protein J7K39_10775, partial [Bacteroidales bacterium]|nr:hypothetical protein [Bacteroidales bacterium]